MNTAVYHKSSAPPHCLFPLDWRHPAVVRNCFAYLWDANLCLNQLSIKASFTERLEMVVASNTIVLNMH